MTSKDRERVRDRTGDAPGITEADLANEKMGRNSLHGDDQAQVRNQRHAVPDVKREADADMIETMKKVDKDYRAEKDLGKGRRDSDVRSEITACDAETVANGGVHSDAQARDVDTTENPQSVELESELESDWKELEQELGWLGTRLEEMRAQAEVIDPPVVEDLEQRYEDITKQVIDLKEKTIARLEDAVSDATDECRSTMADSEQQAGEIGDRVAAKVDAARAALREKVAELGERTVPHREKLSEVASETGERLKSAATEFGHGFGTAWESLKRDVNAAYKRISDASTNGRNSE
jgi:hypothetical protein